MMDKDQYLNYLTDARINAGYSNATTDVNGKPVNSFIANNFPVRNADKDFYNFDWDKYVYNDNAPIYTVDFSVRGGNEKTQFYTSLSYLNQDGIVTKTALKRYSGRVNIVHKINEKIKFGVNVNLSYNDQESPMTSSGYYVNPVFASMLYAPIDPGVIQPESYLYSPSSGFTSYYPENGLNINNMGTYANANFIANQYYDDFSSRTARVITGATVQWNILDELILKGVAGLDYFYLTETEWKDPRPKGNSASYLKGVSETSVGENLIWNETVTLNYLKSFHKHNVNIMLGQETQGDDYRYVDGIKQDFPGTDLHQISSGSVNYGLTGSRNGYNLASFFATGNYNYDSRYFFSASVRRDGVLALSDIPVLRLSDIYLMYAEAEAVAGTKTGAINYLDKIRMRADASGTATPQTISPADLLNLISLEKRKELAYEGHYLFDQKRLQLPINSGYRSDNVLYTTIPYPSNKLAMPIPQSEIDANNNMKQNPY